MSVLIKGMEMPKYCYTCPAYDYIKSFCCVLRTKVQAIDEAPTIIEAEVSEE